MTPKFRAWHINKKKMYDVASIDFYTWEIKLVDRQPKAWAIDYLILMQSTGLKDKNGKEIFEGDIVKGIMIDKTEHILKIIFEGIMWLGRKADGDIEVLDDFGDCPNYNLEVIGNIHENPELLKEKP